MSNTVKFDFPLGSPSPTWGEIAGFLKGLNTNLMCMETVYKMGTDRSICIKFQSETAMKEALRRHQEAVKFCYSSGRTVMVYMLAAGKNIQYVRVFDVPPEIVDAEISGALGKYGKIQRMVREKFPSDLGMDHLYTGVRGVYMEIENEIPPALDIGKWRAKVYYEGLKEKCFACQQEGHRRKFCPTVKQKGKQSQANRQQTYAGVVEAGAIALLNETETNNEDVIDISEEEPTAEKGNEAVTEIVSATPTEFVTGIETEMDEEQLRQFDAAMPQQGLPNFRENIAKMSELIDQLPSSSKDQASQRRAQFATSGSMETRPKKSARRSFK